MSRLPRLQLALVPLFGIGIFAIHGLTITADSVAYVAMARSILAWQGFLGWDASPVGIWPPGYSVVLAPLLGVLRDPVIAAWIVAVTGYSLFCLLAYRLLLRTIEYRRIRILAWVMLCLGAPLTQTWPALLSDGLFLIQLMGFLYIYEGRSSDSGRTELGLTFIAAMMPVTRFIGIIGPALLMLDAAVELVQTRRLRRGMFLRALSVVPFGALAIRNLLVFGEITPALPADPRPIMDGIRRSSEITTRWFIPQFDSNDVLRMTGVVALLTAVVLLRRHGIGWPAVVASLRKSSRWITLLAMYLVMYWWASATRPLDPPNERLLAPVYVLTMLVFWRTAAGLWPALRLRASRRGYLIAAILLVFYGVGHSVNAARIARPWVNRSDFRSAELAAQIADALVRIPPGARIVSNGPDLIYWFSGSRAEWLLRSQAWNSLAGEFEPGAVYVTFADVDRPYLYHPDDNDVVELFRLRSSDESREIRVSEFRPGVAGPSRAVLTP